MHGPRIDLYGWNSCLIVSDLSKRGRLVGYLDATVFGNFGLSNTIYKSKVQTLLFGIQPADVYISAGDIAIMPKKFKMKGVKIAALIATKFKAPDVLRFLNKFFDNCTECTGEKIKPLLIHTDCAGQLKTGIIMATRSDGQVTTQIQYANVNCVLFLRMSFMMEMEIKKTGDWIETAKWGRTIQLQYSNCTIHECGSHTYRAIAAWPKSKDRKKDAPEVKLYEDQFSEVLALLAKRKKDLDDPAVAITEFCLVMVMVEQEHIYCPAFGLHCQIQDTYDEDKAERVAADMKKRMDVTADAQRIGKDLEMNEKLEKVMMVNNNVNAQAFMGKEEIDEMTHTLSEKVTFSMPYLKSVDHEKSKGIIAVAYVYHPVAEDGSICPQVIEGFEHEVSLPFEGGSLRSHIHSPATRKYLFREWSRKLSLSIRTSVSMIEKACNMKLAANN